MRYYRKQSVMNAFDIALFFRQLATLLLAGIPIVKCLDILSQSEDKNSLRMLIKHIKNDLLSGKNFHHCLKKYSSYFNDLTCQLIHIGEQTGKLDIMLQTIANYHEKNQLSQQHIKQALFYPCFITATAIIISFFMFIFIIPRFADLFHDSQITLPMFTRILFYLSTKCCQYYLILPFFLIVILFIANHKIGKSHIPLWRKMTTYLPFIHTFQQKIDLARFSRYLALTLTAGIPLHDALVLTSATCHNPESVQGIVTLNNKINAGFQLHQAMTTVSFFPILLIQMVKVGEEAGMLEKMLNQFADFMEIDIEKMTRRLNELLEPLIMMILGVLIGGLTIGMYLPIFELGNVI